MHFAGSMCCKSLRYVSQESEVATHPVSPTTSPSLECKGSSNPLMVAVREDNDHRYYYIHNTSESETECSVSLNASTYSSPAVLALWDRNQPSRVSHRKNEDGLTEVDIQLPAKGSMIIR